MPWDQQQQREAKALCFRSSNEEMPRANKEKNQYEKHDKKSA